MNKTIEFAADESKTFDYTLNNNPYMRGQCDTFSYLATKRIQIRMWTFMLDCNDTIFNEFKEDMLKLYVMVCECVKQHKHHINHKLQPQFVDVFSNLEKSRKTFSNRRFDKEELSVKFKFIYSALDHMRSCMVEGDTEPPVDLTEFSRITNRFLI